MTAVPLYFPEGSPMRTCLDDGAIPTSPDVPLSPRMIIDALPKLKLIYNMDVANTSLSRCVTKFSALHVYKS